MPTEADPETEENKESKSMKKFVVLLLACALLLGCSGCAWIGMGRDLTQEEKEAIEVGTIVDGIYENTTFALGFAAPEGWKISESSEIREMNGWSEDKDLKEQAIGSLGKPGYFYEMTAERDDSRASVNVCVENVSIMEQPDVTEDVYVAAAVLNAQEHFKEAGCKNVVITKDIAPFAGGEHYFYHVSCKTNDGEDLYYKAMYMKEGIYAAVITATSVEEDMTDEVLSMFYEA